MGCDIHSFLEIESYAAGEYDSLFEAQLHLPRHYQLFAALAGVRGDIQPLFPPRGIPSGLGIYGFQRYYRQIIEYCDALGYRESNYVLTYEVGKAPIIHGSFSRWATSKLGYIVNDSLESPSWLLLSEIHEALRHANLEIGFLPVEYKFLLTTMATAEAMFGCRTRLVFHFDSV